MSFSSVISNKSRLFWLLQISGWVAYGLVNFLTGFVHGKYAAYAYPTMIYAIVGFIVTLGMRYVFKWLWNRSLVLVIIVALLLTALAASVFSLVQVVAFVEFYPTEWRPQSLWEYFADAPFSAYIFISWTGLYFGINYYLMLQEQTEKALKATALAHQAQLKMLRYQLNPHFLFNTLNAISTLVLEKDTDGANDMLTRLSSFLRYSLVNQPTQKVSLDQELEALNLYLDIEKARFEERLKLKFDVEERARDALLPSLLMQPIIENAIKYAIAPSENGGTIALSAHLIGNQLCLVIEDDGPGIALDVAETSKKSSGVGLTNTKERLRQLYGDMHTLKVQNIEPHGLRVTVCMPCEFSPSDEGADDA